MRVWIALGEVEYEGRDALGVYYYHHHATIRCRQFAKDNKHYTLFWVQWWDVGSNRCGELETVDIAETPDG